MTFNAWSEYVALKINRRAAHERQCRMTEEWIKKRKHDVARRKKYSFLRAMARHELTDKQAATATKLFPKPGFASRPHTCGMARTDFDGFASPRLRDRMIETTSVYLPAI